MDVVCSICLSEYEETLLPKLLDCGHHLCKNCLTNILGTDRRCPVCRNPIPESKSNESQFPSCFDLLRLIEERRKLETSKEHFTEKHVVPLRKELLRRKHQIADHLKDLSKELEDITNGLDNLDVIEKTEDFNVETAFQLVNSLQDEATTRVPTLALNFTPSMRCSFRLNEFQNATDFMYQIYNKIKCGQTLYTAARMEDSVKFGKVEIYGKDLLFHSLSATGEQTEPNSSFVLFSDFKACTKSTKFYAFFKLSCNERGLEDILMIELNDNYRVPQFIKLCTGECGPSYKGSVFVRPAGDAEDEICLMQVDNYMRNGVPENGEIDYVINVHQETVVQKNECVVFSPELTGSFNINQILDFKLMDNVFGKVVSPCEYLKQLPEHQMVINDCGILATLEQSSLPTRLLETKSNFFSTAIRPQENKKKAKRKILYLIKPK